MTISRSNPIRAFAISCVIGPVAAFAQPVTVPSGADFALFDVILEDAASIARFRFVAPDISQDGAGLMFADVMDDIEYLCTDVVLPALTASDRAAESIEISFSEREIAFGETAPDVVQFFQPFKVEGNTCIWEEF